MTTVTPTTAVTSLRVVGTAAATTATTAVTPVAAGAYPPRSASRTVLFRAGCPHCKESFELVAGALRLAVGGSARTTFYSFTCPGCGEAVRKPAGERIVELLTTGGVRTMRLHAADR